MLNLLYSPKGTMRFINIFACIAMLFLLSACNTSTTPNYRIGTQGVVMAPGVSNSDQVYEGEVFALGMMLQNLGASSVDNATLMVNYDDFFLALDNESRVTKIQKVSLEAKNQDNPVGDSDYLEYIFKAKAFDVGRANVKTSVNFNICYGYSTDLVTETCIDTRTRTADQRSYTCKAKDYTSGSGQGAPVSITKIESEMLLQETNVQPVFRIYIKNNGRGYTLSQASAQDPCINFTKSSENLNKIRVRAWISSDMMLDCNPSEVRFVDGEAMARCSVQRENLSSFRRDTVNYVSALRVVLNYDYVDSITVPVDIARIEEVEIRSPKTCGYYQALNESGDCESLCAYCARRSDEEICKRNRNTTESFPKDFSCSCTKQKCLALSKTGDCIFGYCPGTSYCCSVDECRGKNNGTTCSDHKVCINGKCALDTTLCQYKFGEQGYSCNSKSACNSTTIRTGFCDGDENSVCCKTV